MKIYRNSIIITGLVSLVTICLAFLINANSQLAIYYDILIGIFGGAIVTLITSIICYRVERLEALETFYLYAKRYTKEISRYNSSAKLEEKIDFYINFANKDLPDIGVAYRDICFLFDITKKNKLYIYNSIYKPINNLSNKINRHYEKDFISYNKLTATDTLNTVMNKFIGEIEDIIIEKKILNLEGIEANPDYCSTTNKFTRAIREDLRNKYYILMYGKKTYNKMLKEEKDQE